VKTVRQAASVLSTTLSATGRRRSQLWLTRKLKITVATTEGYASRPGGAQAELLAEASKHESDRNLSLVLAEFRNYQQGILPAGPGALSLTEFFASIDAGLGAAPAEAPKTQRNDRDILNLLTKRASVLHLGPANYCWFTDPLSPVIWNDDVGVRLRH